MKFLYIREVNLLPLLLVLLAVVLASGVPVEQQSGADAAATTPSQLEEIATPSVSLRNDANKTTAEKESSEMAAATDNLNVTNSASAVTSEHQTAGNDFVGTVGAMTDHVASASSYDPNVYANLITPEAFQQYVNQFGAAYAPYAAAAAAAGAYQTPGLTAYPAPGVVYPAPTSGSAIYPYPAPYIVQTGYEGYLVPTTSSTSDATTNGVSSATTDAATTSRPTSFIGQLLTSLMMSTIFRVVATIISTIAMVLFGNVFAGAICRLTPLCDLPAKTVTYLRGGGAQDVGRMIAEEMTPERVRRATEFVRNAIRKYRALQQLVGSSGEGEQAAQY